VANKVVLLLVLLISLAGTVRVHAEGGIVLENADGSATISLGPDTNLANTLAQMDIRILVEHANGLAYIPLTPPAAALGTLLAAVTPRFVLDRANGNQTLTLTQPDKSLRDLLAVMPGRWVIVRANGNQEMGLVYPKALIGDSKAPTPIALSVRKDETKYLVEWETEEFSRYVLRYGTASGVYDQTITQPFYDKVHAVELLGLIEGTTYYFVIESEDISGNKSTTREQSFVVRRIVFNFLPSLQR
jgi:hypothetical protein